MTVFFRTDIAFLPMYVFSISIQLRELGSIVVQEQQHLPTRREETAAAVLPNGAGLREHSH